MDYGLGAIFDVPTVEASTEELDVSELDPKKKSEVLSMLVARSIKARWDYIESQAEIGKQRRFHILLESANNEDFRKKVMERCTDDVLYRVNNFVYTYDPRLDYPNRPFMTYPFQDKFILDIVDSIERGTDHWVEKSRDMGFSWMILAVLTWGFLFKGRASLIGSYKQDYVDLQGSMDSAFERIRYMLERLPRRMKPDDLNVKFMSISSVKLRCEIAGDAGANFGTGGRRKVVFLDEFALWQYDKTALRKTKDLTKCRIFGGTPEGTMNVYGRVMTKHRYYAKLVFKKSILLRSLHPLKTQTWYEVEKQLRTKLDLAQEVDISYQDSVVGAVYPLFKKMVRVGDYPYNGRFKTYTGMDFGLDTNACLIIQKDFNTNSLYLIKAFKRVNRDIRKFGGLITGRPTDGFGYGVLDEEYDDMEIMEFTSRIKYAGHFGDPYNSQSRSTVNKMSTISGELSKLGVHLQLPPRTQTLEDRIKKAGTTFDRLFIDKSCIDFFESIVQSRYPKPPENGQPTTEKTKPIHDENSHYRTAYEYFTACEPQYDEGFSNAVAVNYDSQI